MNDDGGALKARGEASGEPVDRATAANDVAELTAELAALARQHGLDALATSSTWRGSKSRTPTAMLMGGARFQSYFLHEHCVRMAVGDEAVLLLLGADEVAHLEIDVGGEPGLVVAERG